MDMHHQPTFGESMVERLLKQLPENEFFCYAEPRIDSTTTTSRYPDFIVIWRSKGVLVLEIKDYVEISGGNQREITIIHRDGASKKEQNPVYTTQQYVYRLLELFEKRRELLGLYYGNEKLTFPVEAVAVLPNQNRSTISWLEAENIFPPNRVLSADDLTSVDTLLSALNRLVWTFPLDNRLSNEVIETIHHTIKTVEVRAKPDSDGDEGKKKGTLGEKQEHIVFAPLPVLEGGLDAMLVRGPVGSGKTIVLTKKADLLALLRPDLRILITAFNLDLTADLRKRVPNNRIHIKAFYELCQEILGQEWPQGSSYLDNPGPRSVREWLKTENDLFMYSHLQNDFIAGEIERRKDKRLCLHEHYMADLQERDHNLTKSQIDDLCVAYDLYTEFQEGLRSDGQDASDWTDVIPLTLDALFGHRLERYYDIVMIDEAQDFAPDWMKVIKRLIRPGGFLFMCDDPLQSLWRTYDWKDKGFPRIRTEVLPLPMRTTRCIADFAQSLFDMVEEMRTDDDALIYPARTDHLVIGDKPIMTSFTNREQETQRICNAVMDAIHRGTPPEQIAVISPYPTDDWKDLERLGVYVRHFNKIKGLEFEMVFIPRLEDVFGNKLHEHLITRRTLYRKLFVAMTRARSQLYISFTGELPRHLRPLERFGILQQQELVPEHGV